MIKLSIIIPYYNAEEYIGELLAVLEKQITDEIEVILVDDGSKIPFKNDKAWLQVHKKENGGCASARNVGLVYAKGEYIQFIDADDLVPSYFIEKLLNKIEEKPDMIDYSWRSLNKEGLQQGYKLKSNNDRLKNPSVCTRCFKRSFLGDVRFNEKKDSTEDEDFSRKVGYLDPDKEFKHAAITDYMYYYRTAVDNSKVKRFKKGMMRTKRIVYHYSHVTKDMTWLLEEIKKEDEINEVWLITSQNDIPELKRYCQMAEKINIWGHELRGEPYAGYTQIDPAIRTDILFYCEYVNKVGGIATFLYNTCQQLKKYYDIVIMYDDFPEEQIDRLSKVVPVMKNDGKRAVVCDTIVLNRLKDKIPPDVTYNKSVQMCHACLQKTFKIPYDSDYLVNVSQAAKDSWGDASKHGIVINNLSYPEADELLLVSATRMQAGDKGDNDERIRKLANMLNDKNIRFTWLNFSDKGLNNPPRNFINMAPRLNIQSFIRRADYLVQLSDLEAYSMSVLEALNLNTAVLATPFPSLFEEGFIDGKTGYVIPYDMNFDVEKILTVPKFEFRYDNQKIIDQWKELLSRPGNKRTTASQITERVLESNNELVKIKVVKTFRDKNTNILIAPGETMMERKRVEEILKTQKKKKMKLIEVL